MTTVATGGGGFDYGSALDKILGTYQAVSTARVQRDVAKYNMAGATQLAALNNPQAGSMLEAYNISNPVKNNTGSVSTNTGGSSINTKTLLIGGAVLAGGLLIYRALK